VTRGSGTVPAALGSQESSKAIGPWRRPSELSRGGLHRLQHDRPPDVEKRSEARVVDDSHLEAERRLAGVVRDRNTIRIDIGLDGSVWGAQTRSPSRGRAVFVNQSAESILPADAIEPARGNDAEVWSGLWRRESESAMRAMSVVVLDVDT
jgi:hypothetical protein